MKKLKPYKPIFLEGNIAVKDKTVVTNMMKGFFN